MTQRIPKYILTILFAMLATVGFAADILWSSVEAQILSGTPYNVGAGNTLIIDKDVVITSNVTINGNVQIGREEVKEWKGLKKVPVITEERGSLSVSGGSLTINGNIEALKDVCSGVNVTAGANVVVNGDVSNKSSFTINNSFVRIAGNATNSGTISLNNGAQMSVNNDTEDNKTKDLSFTNNGTINLNKSYLGAENLVLKDDSKLNYSTTASAEADRSFVYVSGNMAQNKGSKITPDGDPDKSPKSVYGTLIVVGRYDDATGWEERPWAIRKNGSSSPLPLIVNPNFELYVSKYVYDTGGGALSATEMNVDFGLIKGYTDARAELSTHGFNADMVSGMSETATELLPIELTYFNVEQFDNELLITWETAAEVNNDFFTVEYSLDGVNFSALESVAGAGTSSFSHEYSVSVLAEQFAGVIYFRLKQTDFDENVTYSNVEVLNVVAQEESFFVYPTPATTEIHVVGNYELVQCFDMFNRKVKFPQIADNTYSVAHLAKGNYVLVLKTKNGTKSLQFLKK